ncbi:MAG TPA: CsbD family protein [Actinomycetes bacterium]|nr:CsbD family protein [Actinomycetes bacterium]
MGAEDKLQNKADEMAGKAKEKVGEMTGNESMEKEGKKDETKANVKQAGEKIKDVFKD